MAFKFIAFATFVAAASAGLIPAASHQSYHVVHPVPVAYTHGESHVYAVPSVAQELPKYYDAKPYDHVPQYSYSYDVHDAHTGDIKRAQETRNGDAVEGSYSFIEADGSRRVVHYTADDHKGFNAVVENKPAYDTVKIEKPVAVKTEEHVAVTTEKPVAYTHSVAHVPVLYHVLPVVKVEAPVAHAIYSAPAISHSYYH